MLREYDKDKVEDDQVIPKLFERHLNETHYYAPQRKHISFQDVSDIESRMWPMELTPIFIRANSICTGLRFGL